jgi:hypothetical protein
MTDSFRLKQIEELVRMGLMPLNTLPLLKQALSHYEHDAFLPLTERRVFYMFLKQLMNQVFNDTVIYRLVRQRTAMNKHEEYVPVNEEDIDLKKTPEGMLDTMATNVKSKVRAGGKTTPSEKRLASRAKAELRRRRDNAKDKKSVRESYQVAMEKTLQDYGVMTIAQIPIDKVSEFFQKVEELYNSGE